MTEVVSKNYFFLHNTEIQRKHISMKVAVYLFKL